MTELLAEQLKVQIYENRTTLGRAAAEMAAARIRELLQEQEMVNIIFAAAASQNEFLDALVEQDIDWQRIQAFHMDEYTMLPENDNRLFGVFLKERIFGKVPFRHVYYINGQAKDRAAECERYAALLRTYPVDITCMGIGENSHLAFNDPHVADFNDPSLVKIVDLDEACKQQQVNEGCFEYTGEVPIDAYTLTIPALLQARHIFCMVPGATKAEAVLHTLKDEITPQYPSTILRTHPDAILFLDRHSAQRIV
ncbi:glucosamine-6-phosphate deaminase [Chitinophaga agrisoli]|uniref:Glucosamine-6-phosphate deaminase n=1 Tax=Chitinophaga agrisoli TaxID=2607653 RepID=A0A5B2VJV8_9BACT|nr:glucosamine-6-phosphate deaminase [Chitinophaga agrisoli]KAA2239235.1 glucosamine-6-phosphate deaminase [Chitinophaga agrisoli]